MTDPSYGYLVGDEVVLANDFFLEDRCDHCNWKPIMICKSDLLLLAVDDMYIALLRFYSCDSV